MANEAVRFIRFTCPCGGSLTVKPDEAKKLVSCPFCSRPLRASDFKIKPSSSGVLDQSQSSIEQSSGRSGIMASPTGEGFPDKPNRNEVHRAQVAADKVASQDLTKTQEVNRLPHQSQQGDGSSRIHTMQRSMTETDVGASGIVRASDSIAGSGEWSPNKIVKPSTGKKSARPFRKQSKLKKSERDLYMTVGLCTFAALFLGGILFWFVIKSNQSPDDEVAIIESAAGQTELSVAGGSNLVKGTTVEEEKPLFNKPCIRLLSGEWQLTQALDSEASDVRGVRLFVDMKIENLTECDITLIKFELKCQDERYLGKRYILDYEFKKPLMPGEIASIDLSAKSGNWDSINAYAIRFESSDGQVNSDRVGPYLLDN